MLFSIYLNFTSIAEGFDYTKCGILEIFQKPGLVDEALGKISNLTPD